MPCNNLSSEDYSLWSLGLLEGPQAELIRTHLNDNCPKCTAAVRASNEFWAIFGAAAGLEAGEAPSPLARDRILKSLKGRPAVVPQRAPMWQSRRFIYTGAIAAGLLV